MDLAGTLARALSHRTSEPCRLPHCAVARRAVENRETGLRPIHPSTHSTEAGRRSGISQPRRPALFISAMAADGSRGQSLDLPSRPDHNIVATARSGTGGHGFLGVLRREEVIPANSA